MRKFNLEQAIEILGQTPFTVKSLLGNLSEDWTYNEENSDSWSPFDVIGHYIQGEKTDWIERAEVILAQGENRTFEPFDRFAQFSTSNGKKLNELLEEFIDLRSKNLETLKSWCLSGKQLELRGIHPEFGEVTLEQLISTWVVHDLTHIRQIVTFLARRYSEDVGPWKAYLSIVQK